MTRPAPTRAVTQAVAYDGVVGAAIGLLLACAYVAATLDLRQLADSAAPLKHLAALVGAVAAQGALISGLAGVYLRRLATPD